MGKVHYHSLEKKEEEEDDPKPFAEDSLLFDELGHDEEDPVESLFLLLFLKVKVVSLTIISPKELLIKEPQMGFHHPPNSPSHRNRSFGLLFWDQR